MQLGQAQSRRLALSAIALAALAALLVLGPAAERASAACPSFRVLHSDRIGPAQLPAGNYEITPAASISCQNASRLFTRFLQDWDGNLPRPWRVVARGSGRADFMRGRALGFSVERTGGGGNNTPTIGRICPDPFVVNAGDDVGPLFFPRGQYLLYLPPRSGITCNRAARLFTRFLGQPGGRLPFPWRVRTQTATFFKPQNPTRSAFRVEPRAGVSGL